MPAQVQCICGVHRSSVHVEGTGPVYMWRAQVQCMCGVHGLRALIGEYENNNTNGGPVSNLSCVKGIGIRHGSHD